jgi:hypothetical protein
LRFNVFNLPRLPPGFPKPLPPLDKEEIKQTDALIAEADGIIAKMDSLIGCWRARCSSNSFCCCSLNDTAGKSNPAIRLTTCHKYYNAVFRLIKFIPVSSLVVFLILILQL